MCGIFAHISKHPIYGEIPSVNNISKRGPDHSSYTAFSENVSLGFHRKV